MDEQVRIAVIGMACRFPGAGNLDEYWQNLIEGKDTIKHFTNEELSGHEYNFNSLKDNPDYVKARGVLKDIDKFDAAFFGMTPNEAALTDPQHRLWLETCWEAFENAGCDPYTFNGPIGVFAGGYLNSYLLNNILRDRDRLENYIRLRTTDSFQLLTGNDVAFIPTKTAYKFNLKGPAVNVQTACSTSLVAISLACQSLVSFESDICVAGGVCIVVPQESGYLYQEGAIPSPDGKCKPFDENGKGTVFSNGVGVVILRRLEDAIRDRDRVYAVVRGWALNNDGNHKVSYMAPSVEGQAEAIMMAQTFAEIRPEQIGYIEAHGTATPLGDPIELTALNKAFARISVSKQSIGIGSVKSNIGHTDAAAGVASFIKSCLSVYSRTIPPSINFSKPNPHFDFTNSPFYVLDKLKKWESNNPLIIGVSSFGIGGTNAHVIIEEPPVEEEGSEMINEWPYLLPLSARSEAALSQRKTDLLYILRNPGIRLKDAAFTLQSGRNHMPLRTYCVAGATDDALSENSFNDAIQANESKIQIAFMFSGQGAQYAGMGRELYNSAPGFRLILDECFEIFRKARGFDIKELIIGEIDPELAGKRLAETDVTQPALFIIEYALARLYESYGIKADYFIGHSIGEYAAACLSGVFDLESALQIVMERGRLMQQMPSGRMYAIRCSVDKLIELENSGFEVAADNSVNQCTVSLNNLSGDSFLSSLNEKGIHYVQLNTSHAFHSSSFDPILEKFSRFVNGFKMNPPTVPFISCVTGEFITEKQAMSCEYWATQLRNTVLFRKGISVIAARQDVVFLEIGPGTHLTGLARQNSAVHNKRAVVSSLGKNDAISEKSKIISSIGALWANGVNIDFSVINPHDECHKTTLPAYPFQRKRYWIDYFQSSESTSTNSPEQVFMPPQSARDKETITALKDLLCQTSGYAPEDVSENTSFEKLGFDSLFLTQYARNISMKFGVKIEFKLLVSEYSNLAKLSHEIDRNLLLKNENNLKIKNGHVINNFVKFQPHGTKEPLIILHGQNADSFIPDFLGKDQPYYGFVHPGSDGEEIRFENVSEMARAYLDQLLEHKPYGPYYIGGFSFGGVLAYEMARQLEGMGHKVPFVILFDSFARKEPFKWHNDIYRIIRSDVAGSLYRRISRILKIAACESSLRYKGTTPLRLRSFYIVDKYFTLADTFKPGGYSGKLILFQALENHSFLKYLGWENNGDELEVIPLNANHTSILKAEDSIRTIQREIKRILDSVSRL